MGKRSVSTVSVKDSQILRECPFCGGEAETLTAEYKHGGYVFCIMCNDCCSRGDAYDNEAEAVAAWNTRAERGTLTVEQVMAIAGKHQPDYCSDTHACFDWQAIADELNSRAERTCKSTTDDNAWCFACSECGKSFPRSKLHLAHNHGEINYCPNCGARVKEGGE